MDDTMIANRSRTDEPPAPVKRQTFEVLQELTRHGYVPDSQPLGGGDGILLRHGSAPDLILHEDGTLEVPLHQARRENATPAPVPLKARPKRKIYWGRGLLFLVLLALTTALSFMIFIALMLA